MPRCLKRGMDAGAIKAADAKVRETVEEHSRRHRRAQGRGGPRPVEEIRQLGAEGFQAVARRDRRGHRAGAQARPRGHQVRAGAGAQLRAEAERDHARPRGRDAARRRARPPPHPGEFDRLLRAGRALSDGRLGAYVDRHRQGRRREAHHRLRAAVQGRAASGHRRRHAFRRRRRHLRARRRAGGRRHGARHRDHQAGRHDRRPRQRLCGGGQAPAVRPRRHRPAGRPDRDADHRRRQRRRRNLRHRSARPGRARADLAGGDDHQFREARARHHERGRAAAENPADRRRRRRGLEGLWRGHRLRQLRGDGPRGRPRRLRARAGDDARSGLFPQQHEELRLAVPWGRAPTSPMATR